MNEVGLSEGNVLFPVFLKLNQIQTVVVGGGNVGLEKVEALLKNDPKARIRIIAPLILPALQVLADGSEFIEILNRKVRGGDLKGADLLILATDDYSLHEKLKRKAKKLRLLTNVADTPDLCDFYLGSTVKKGDLKIGISTNGKSPTFAKRFREVLEDILPDSTPELLNQLKTIRDDLKGDFNEKVERLNEITSVLTKKGK
ncbi:bifunctional precorrin-2 dehydrogenase/sirohydrochlorin ferrochelatase [Marinoscillum sp. 108]|uniref:precorrin-2 dehydrogenase/sirohydrochlorin ferrochelatase family protein n=1 Tax=Marinoscillum sp. 108 TaxID=2653151 RepID=UPI0012F22076|nr:NAD(P)-dependent oxidoreductase [Marinoscillum sp. 108]VXD14723.1 Precorrin-2 dehydrogenase/sirohydrochlorin ferrochelatase [Marinoscillum sp. 108]